MEAEPNLSNYRDEGSIPQKNLTEYTDEDDEHFCIKCKRTFIGMHEYISHRRSRCNKSGVPVIKYNLHYIFT